MRRFLAAMLLCFTAAAPVTAATVTIDSSHFSTFAADGTLAGDSDNSTAYGTRTLTSVAGASASSAGTSSTTDIDWQSTGSGALFNFDFAHVRVGRVGAFANSGSAVLFTIDQTTTYSLSGLYAAIGSDRTVFDVRLYDFTTNRLIFRDYSRSESTANESFILGAVGDADSNVNFGSLAGSLLAGQYELFFESAIQATEQSDLGATAMGCLTFSIGGATSAGDCAAAPAPVPLPAAAWLLSGLGGLGFLGRRRKTA